jgi:hypothetical protein
MRTALVFAVAILGGCAPVSNSSPSPTSAPLGADTRRIAALEADVSVLRTRVESLQTQLFKIDGKTSRYEQASFDPTDDKGFQRVDTNLGPFLIVLDRVEALGDGSKAFLQIGNITTATFRGAKLNVSWGMRRPTYPQNASAEQEAAYSTAYSTWLAAEDSKEVTLTEDLRPTAWNLVSVTLPRLPPSKVGHIDVGMELSQALLYTARRN